jgi:hypothetical protein
MRLHQIALYALVVTLTVTGITLLIPPKRPTTESCISNWQMLAHLPADQAQ